jgi:hypothetical protein
MACKMVSWVQKLWWATKYRVGVFRPAGYIGAKWVVIVIFCLTRSLLFLLVMYCIISQAMRKARVILCVWKFGGAARGMVPHFTYQCTIPRYYMNNSDALSNTHKYMHRPLYRSVTRPMGRGSPSLMLTWHRACYTSRVQTPVRPHTSTSESLASLKLVYPGVFGALRLDATQWIACVVAKLGRISNNISPWFDRDSEC